MVAASETIWQDTERYRDRLSKEAPPTIDSRYWGSQLTCASPECLKCFQNFSQMHERRSVTAFEILPSLTWASALSGVRSRTATHRKAAVRRRSECRNSCCPQEHRSSIMLVNRNENRVYPKSVRSWRSPCTWFYDSAGNTVLIAADTERQIRVALSRAIAILVEPVAITPMQVDAMLAVEPREIAGVLDDYDIPQIKDFEPSSSTNVADQQPLDLADVGDKSEFGSKRWKLPKIPPRQRKLPRENRTSHHRHRAGGRVGGGGRQF